MRVVTLLLNMTLALNSSWAEYDFDAECQEFCAEWGFGAAWRLELNRTWH